MIDLKLELLMKETYDLNWESISSIHNDLLVTKKLVYEPSKFRCTKLIIEPESIEYGAYEFELGTCTK